MSIKSIFEQTIQRGGFDLTEMLERIDAYNVGDKVTFNGARYVCKMANCVWSPAVYPEAWEVQAS